MNPQFLIAGLIAALSALAHAILGERTNIRHLWPSEVPGNEKIEFRATWHALSAVLALTAIALLGLALTDSATEARITAQVIAIAYVGMSAAWLAVSLRERVQQIIKSPQWLLLLAIAGLAWWGAISLAG